MRRKKLCVAVTDFEIYFSVNFTDSSETSVNVTEKSVECTDPPPNLLL